MWNVSGTKHNAFRQSCREIKPSVRRNEQYLNVYDWHTYLWHRCSRAQTSLLVKQMHFVSMRSSAAGFNFTNGLAIRRPESSISYAKSKHGQKLQNPKIADLGFWVRQNEIGLGFGRFPSAWPTRQFGGGVFDSTGPSIFQISSAESENRGFGPFAGDWHLVF